jgi:hypothetical protein
MIFVAAAKPGGALYMYHWVLLYSSTVYPQKGRSKSFAFRDGLKKLINYLAPFFQLGRDYLNVIGVPNRPRERLVEEFVFI